MFLKSKEGSTGRLVELCLAYLFTYVIYSVATKYYTGPAIRGLPGVDNWEFLVYSTLGGSLVCLAVVSAFRWARMESANMITWGKIRFPAEYLYIIPSGVCTAVVIPTTTLLYVLLRSVMVAMLIMRGSVIIFSRIIDAIQIRQGILHKKVFWEEEAAVLFAIAAVGLQLFFVKEAGGGDLIKNTLAMMVLGSYLLAYFIRIYIMNYYKNTRSKGCKQDNKAFFAVEQVSASITILLALTVLLLLPSGSGKVLDSLHHGYLAASAHWPMVVAAGGVFGIVAFSSVFIFMFKGRTATFAGLANRLTSLVAGTLATLLFAMFFGGKYPKTGDWLALIFIFVAVGFMTRSEMKRSSELKREGEICEPAPAGK
ncbi:MAG TPA: hypothetical protein DDW31_06125 [candidate division Zixibacteria bacterium]|nr:hypothetical protein [candidate division Zixibacteria bacterium]